jgi:hypothetical protein
VCVEASPVWTTTGTLRSFFLKKGISEERTMGIEKDAIIDLTKILFSHTVKNNSAANAAHNLVINTT